MRVVSGHLGWVRCIDVEPGNEWFCTGSADRTIKIWDLASGTRKQTLACDGGVKCMQLYDRNKMLLTGLYSSKVVAWDLASGTQQQTLDCNSVVNCMQSCEGVLLTGLDSRVCTWRMRM